MKTHLSNAAYGVADYAAYPVAMLLAAPVLLRNLGTAQYGVWIVCTAVVSSGAVIAAGFGDAHIQYVASQRNVGPGTVERAVRSMMGINLLLGLMMTLIGLALVPRLSRHVVPDHSALYLSCVKALRLASLMMLIRAIESVCISTQRAFERYGSAVRVSILGRVATVGAAVVAARTCHSVTRIMWLSFVVMALGTAVQLVELNKLLGGAMLWPCIDRETSGRLFEFGAFSWVLAACSVVFSYVDRLVLGVSLGAVAVASYALCVQMTQPIYGITAAGLHFLFPFLANRQAANSATQMSRAVLTAVCVNFLFVLASTAAVVFWGKTLLALWVGQEVARSASAVLVPIAWSFALLGLNVTSYYTLMALGRIRSVTMIHLVGGTVMLLVTAWLLPEIGIQGIVRGRLCYALITLTMYYPMIRSIFLTSETQSSSVGSSPLGEEA